MAWDFQWLKCRNTGQCETWGLDIRVYIHSSEIMQWWYICIHYVLKRKRLTLLHQWHHFARWFSLLVPWLLSPTPFALFVLLTVQVLPCQWSIYKEPPIPYIHNKFLPVGCVARKSWTLWHVCHSKALHCGMCVNKTWKLWDACQPKTWSWQFLSFMSAKTQL